jgi:hypothetical protein
LFEGRGCPKATWFQVENVPSSIWHMLLKQRRNISQSTFSLIFFTKKEVRKKPRVAADFEPAFTICLLLLSLAWAQTK